MKKLGFGVAAFLLALMVVSCGGSEKVVGTFGSPGDDGAYSIQQTADGGYIVAGYISQAHHDDFSDPSKTYKRIWVAKLKSNRDQSWAKAYGPAGVDSIGRSAQHTADGGFIVAGNCTNPATSVLNGCVIKLNGAGNVVWQKLFAEEGYAEANSVRQNTGGDYVVAGTTGPTDHSDSDAWVTELDASGNTVWSSTYTVTAFGGAYAISQTADGGYIVQDILSKARAFMMSG